MPRQVWAYTAPQKPFPAFASIANDGTHYTLSVRGYDSPITVSRIQLSEEQLMEMCNLIVEYFDDVE
jgi:hypothetical protein